MFSKIPRLTTINQLKDFLSQFNDANSPSTDCYCSLTLVIATLIGLVVYGLYVRKFRHYIYHQVNDIKEEGRRVRGKCPPFFPNGWYRVLNSDELRTKEVKYLDYCGRHIAIYRGTNGRVYAVHAFCAHMGANLGVGGVVKSSKCLQCPFHGWVFDGETGDCVVSAGESGEKLVKKTVESYEYNDIKKLTKKDGKYLTKCSEGHSKLKTYEVKEINGSIMVWIDSREENQHKYPFEPLPIEIKSYQSYRGESINYVNCHIQEIPENGADIRHFDFLHRSFVAFINFDWVMTSHRASAPDIFEVMTHKRAFINDFKQKLLKRYITEENKNYVNVISLDCYVNILGFKFFFFNATGFQVGPALVYLFLKSRIFEITFEQAIIPMQKFHQRVSHKIYASRYLPYGLTAFMLYSEVQQVLNDMDIWNKKVFGDRLNYNMKTGADVNLCSWRNWFAQFYDGCHEYEKASDLNDW